MGVTIHYVGQLKNPARMGELLAFVRDFAETRKWDLQVIQDEDHPDIRGVIVLPHTQCEPLQIIFGPRYKFDGWVKTQFAGPASHVEVVHFLQQIQPILGRLGVRDEGEYWTTGDETILHGHIDTINRIIAEYLAKDANVRIQVKTPGGRITDVIQ